MVATRLDKRMWAVGYDHDNGGLGAAPQKWGAGGQLSPRGCGAEKIGLETVKICNFPYIITQ
jgi:hypothetical protein